MQVLRRMFGNAQVFQNMFSLPTPAGIAENGSEAKNPLILDGIHH